MQNQVTANRINIFIDSNELINHHFKFSKLIDHELSKHPRIFRNEKEILILNSNFNNNLYSIPFTFTKLKQFIFLYELDTKTNQYIQIPVPGDVIRSVLTLTKSNIKYLNMIINNPYIDSEFNIIKNQGYISKLKAYQSDDFTYDLNGWTINRAKESLSWICDNIFKGFIFDTELDRMGAVSALLSGIELPNGKGFPGFFVTGELNSGKSTLINIIDFVVNNETSTVELYNNSKKFEKNVFKLLTKNKSILLKIPVNGTFQSNILQTLITEPFINFGYRYDHGPVYTNLLYLFNGTNIKIDFEYNSRLMIINLKNNQNNLNRCNFNKLISNNRTKIISCIFDIILAGKDYNPKFESTRFPLLDKFVRFPIHKLTGLDIAKLFKDY